jgi:3-hydroxymyristoyl/3-hydroxydecanoyl-(acyl carrier protein) dehydratase
MKNDTGGGRVFLGREQIADALRLPCEYVVIDEAVYDREHPNEVKIVKLLAEDDIDFVSHIPDYFVYPDYAIDKVLNQGIRLLIRLLYPDIEDIPVGMIERAKLREILRPNDRMNVLIKEWQVRNKIARFEIAIENQKGIVVYESTVYGTLLKRGKSP